jgi:hypothetical protein
MISVLFVRLIPPAGWAANLNGDLLKTARGDSGGVPTGGGREGVED